MTYRVLITEAAQRDIRENTAWWSKHRSSSQAQQWYSEIYPVMQSLCKMPERCGLSDQQPLARRGVHELLFGIGGKSTHRIFFWIKEDQVEILRVRSAAQDKLLPSGLA